ncbi:MAG: hypothetical protein ACOH1T_07775 [Microbacteriaceae bacterium]
MGIHATRLGFSLAAVLLLSGCVAPIAPNEPVARPSVAPAAFSCDALVPDDILETAGIDPMHSVAQQPDAGHEYPGIPQSVAVAQMGGVSCLWMGQENAFDGGYLASSQRASLRVTVLPSVAAEWRDLAEPYGPAIEDDSCSTLISRSTICGSLRLLQKGVLVGIQFSGFAVDAGEGEDSSETLDAASDSYATMVDSIMSRISAAPPQAREFAAHLPNAPGADCSALLSNEAVALLASSSTATGQRRGLYPSIESTALVAAGGGTCLWSADREYDDPSSGPDAHVFESVSFGQVDWLSNAAASMPPTTDVAAVALHGLSAPDGAWMRQNALAPVIDIRLDGHWVAVSLTDDSLPSGTLERFAQAVVDRLVG